MNERALRQYRAYKRRAGKICRGKAMPRMRYLVRERIISAGPVFHAERSLSIMEKAEQDFFEPFRHMFGKPKKPWER